MTITNDHGDPGIAEYALPVPAQRAAESSRRAAGPQCECPDFCPVQHDDN